LVVCCLSRLRRIFRLRSLCNTLSAGQHVARRRAARLMLLVCRGLRLVASRTLDAVAATAWASAAVSRCDARCSGCGVGGSFVTALRPRTFGSRAVSPRMLISARWLAVWRVSPACWLQDALPHGHDHLSLAFAGLNAARRLAGTWFGERVFWAAERRVNALVCAGAVVQTFRLFAWRGRRRTDRRWRFRTLAVAFSSRIHSDMTATTNDMD